MNPIRFLQIHWLSSYPATLINRDDAGLAKRMPFGGSVRSRISSQCLKRHWRLAGQADVTSASANPWALHNVGLPMGIRSKRIVEDRILPIAATGLDIAESVVEAVRDALLAGLYGKKAADPKQRQALLFGEPEIEYLADKARSALESGDAGKAKSALELFFREEKKNLNVMANGAGLESALFGRMVTSDPAANRDAAIHVAHALSVHAIERELDFMTVVDDLKAADTSADAGAAGVFDMELASGVYYGYVVVDVELLVANLAGERQAAAKVVEHLLHLIAEVSPGAKKGSTAPYAFAEFMLVEAGNRQPRTLANAFRQAVPTADGDVAGQAVKQLQAHLQRMDAAYGAQEDRWQLSTLEARLEDIPVESIDGLAGTAARAVMAEPA